MLIRRGVYVLVDVGSFECLSILYLYIYIYILLCFAGFLIYIYTYLYMRISLSVHLSTICEECCAHLNSSESSTEEI